MRKKTALPLCLCLFKGKLCNISEPEKKRHKMHIRDQERSAMAIMFCFCLFHFLLFSALSAMARDVDLLISFKNSLANPSLLSDWNHAKGVCEFRGIACKAGYVSSLTIHELPLGADFSSVSAHILSIASLETLSLHSINLTGFISTPTKCTAQLKRLDLSSNRLRGSISDAASLAGSCPSLQSLNLSNNSIGQTSYHSCPVPPNLKMLDLSYNKIATNKDIQWLFSKLGILKHLDLSNNNIKGSIPHISNCTFLQYLDLSSNQLSGTVPASTFSNCLNLTYLNISSNHFTGNVPPDIETSMNLVILSLSNNNFSGENPISSLVAMPRLQLLELAINNFSGSLPHSISNLTSLEILDLSANRFSGPIPHSLCTRSVSSLKVLYLQDNYFTGSIPDSLRNCTNLVSLDLSLNFLSGSIPGSLGFLSYLKDLIMWQNYLNGDIPSELSSLKSLKNLILDYNNLTGTIHNGLVNCTNLNWISLASNQLTGSIPIWIGKLENLVILILRNNSLSGSIPQGLGDCKGLVYLDLSSNRLNGSIPPTLAKQSSKIVGGLLVVSWRFIQLRIGNNSQCHGVTTFLEFDGIRSDDLMRLPSTRYCNFLRVYTGSTGDILRSNISMLFLDLSYNQLDGQIPTEISAMQFLGILNLEHNHLSGQLPEKLGDITHLGVLYLSHNMLEGMIPSSFSTLSLSELDLSNNQLYGPIPERGSLITFPAYAFENNSGLCGFPLLPCNGSSISREDRSQLSSTNHQSSQSWQIALGLLFSLFFIIVFVIGQLLKQISVYFGCDYVSVLY
ncbi:hypothetical protein LUZ63_013598 [Rhynchospora breviuscula]|uniref:non-specific serine/threonine protein kinase n=1 Tax=Rhynchospora breviuscula TaxID=2022672 RepID=A0A9Q0HKT1_9POAL|nr:hypothetical protein LUZ63_013598 [Rhynchospora breviuscula]